MGAEGTSGPVLLVVAGEDQLTPLARALEHRFDRDYRVLREGSADAGLATLQRLAAAGEEIALVLVAEQIGGRSGYDVLAEAQARHHAARRAVIARYADLTTNVELNRAMALSRLDSFVMERWDPPEEGLYRPLGELLAEWTSATRRPRFEAVRVVGDRWDPRSHALRDNLERNGLPYGFDAADAPEGRALLRETGCDGARLPVLVLFDGRVLVQPSFADIAEAFGIRTRPDEGRYDVAIVGAGPAGLSAAVYAASEGLRTLHLEQEALGGQAGTTSRIRNYLGFPRGVTGQRLALSANQQESFFGAVFVLGGVAALRPGEGEHALLLADGGEARARAVVIATGAAYRRLGVPALEELLGRGVFYGAAVAEAWAMAGEEVFVVGAGNSAGQAALHLAHHARRVTLVVRGGGLARSMSDYLIQEIAATANIDVRLGAQVVDGGGRGRLEQLTLEDGGRRHEVAAGGLFLLIGAEPHTAWLPSVIERDGGGYVLTGRDLVRDGAPPSGWSPARPPGLLETSIPGIFVAGDVRHGSIKRVAAAVGEGSTAIQLVHQHLAAEAPEAARAR